MLRRVLPLLLLLALTACRQPPPSTTVVVAIENSPNSLDPRIGTDAMAERIGGLLYDALVVKDEHFNLQPWLALSWQQVPGTPDWIFHLRDRVRFSDDRPLEAEDVAYTINSLHDGSLITSKAGAFANVLRAEAVDRLTVRLRLKQPDPSLLFNLSDGLFGVVPRGSDAHFAQHPIGSGPFRYVSSQVDREVVLERNPGAWAGPPALERLRFAVIPDAVTVALELEKGSVDVAANELTLDLVHALKTRSALDLETGPGSPVMYLNFNVSRGPLADGRVRQAIRCSLDRQAIVDAIWRGQATLAATLLPASHWAAAAPATLPACDHDPQRARALLEQAGYHARPDGTRLALEMKTSQDESTRLLAQVFQQQMRAAGIALTLRASEFGAFYSDITQGRFEMYALRWIGSNEDPDIFHYTLGSDRFPPRGGNRGRYRNPQLDRLLARAASEDTEARRRDYLAVQAMLAEEVPVIPLFYPNNEIVHTARITNVHPRIDGSFQFLREARLR